MLQASDDRRNAWLAGLLALACVALLETARVPVRVYAGAPGLAFGVWLFALGRALTDFSVSALVVPLAGSVSVVYERRRARALERGRKPTPPWWPLLPRALFGVIGVAHAYLTLARYPDFAAYPPALVAFALLAVAVAAACALSPSWLCAAGARSRRWRALGLVLPLGAGLGAVLCYALNQRLYPGDYPTLHASLLQCALLLLALALWHAFGRWPRTVALLSLRSLASSPRGRMLRRTLSIALAAFLLVGTAVALIGQRPLVARARPYFMMYTTLGQAQPLLDSRARGAPDASLLPEAQALALFARHRGLPELPADFALGRYNVLLVLSEALRADQTSLGNAKLRTTPMLAGWSQRGGLVMSDAYAPSSGTYQSLGGLFGMSYPSFLALEVWRKAWTGHFRDPGPTVAELFQRSAYDTFWVGHDNASCFDYTVLGYDRGFATRKLITPKQTKRANADERIAGVAIEQLERAAKQRRPFFGWVFFVSPHSNYRTHYDDMPSERPIDKYRQEVRFVDEQFGKVMDALERLQLLERTIVIFSGDHGEEFGEHGGAYHKSTVYSESTHVPLVIWLPGGEARRVSAPTSTAYLFPWLFLHGSHPMREAALLRLRRDFGPMLQRTAGAVVVELLGNQRMKSSLVYPDRKYDYDFAAELHEAYRDRKEQHDLFERDPELTADARKRIAAYLQLRAERQRFVLRPDVKDPRPGRE